MGRAATQAMRERSRMEARSKSRTSYNSIIERSPAAMIATGYGRGGEEKKFLDYGDALTADIIPPQGTPIIQHLNGMTSGAAFYQRIGNKITMKSVHCKVRISPRVPATAGTGNNQTCRFMLIYDRQTNGAYPTLPTILTDYASDGTTQTSILSGMNPTQTGRFVILREHFIQLMNINTVADLDGAASSLVEQDGQWFINWYVKLKDLETIYQTSTGGIGDIMNGALYLVCFSDIANTDASAGIFYMKTRLRYVG